MPSVTPTATFDSYATDTGGFDASGSLLNLGSNSAFTNAQIAALFEDVQVPKGATVSSAPFSINLSIVVSGTARNDFDIGAHKTAQSTAPSGSTDQRGRTITTARLSRSFDVNSAAGPYTYDLAPVVQEIVNLAEWQPGNDILIIVRSTGGSGGGGSGATAARRVAWSSLESANPPSMSVTYSLPTVTGQMALAETATDRLSGTVNAEAPEPSPPVVAQGSFAETVLEGFSAKAVRGDLSKNYPFTFLADLPDTHHFVTETGEVYGFTARVSTLLGAIRSGMSGALDTAWYPTSGLLTREPAPLEFEAALFGRDNPRLERDRIAAALKDVRALHLPDGRVFDLDYAQIPENGLIRDDALSVSCAVRSAEPRHVLLSGTIGAAFETFGSTPQVPIYAVDPAGGVRANILPKSVPQGSLCFGVRSAERGVEGYASVGTPVYADGTSHPSSITVSYRRKHLRLSLYGVETRVREEFLASYGAALVCYLFWREGYAHLVTVSSLGVYHHDLPVGTPAILSERVITAGVRADGVGFGGFIAPGAYSLDAPFFSLAVPNESEAVRVAQKLYAEMTRKGVSYEVMPPAYAVTLSRADTKALELAPGESLTFDLAATRAGYAGALDFAVSADTLSASYTVLGTSGDITSYRVTLNAPAETPEAAYTFRATVKAQGADNPGSLLKDVRDAFDAVVQVAASPVIATNATVVNYASDTTQKRDAEILRDSSANANTLFWAGYARPNRTFTGILATGVYGAAVYSGTLANAAQAHRMNGGATYSMVFAEIEKSKPGTTATPAVMFQVAADNSENGIWLIRAEGGFKLRTVNGTAVVTSLDTLTWRGAYTRLILIIGTTTVTLLDRDTGSSISLVRPAWVDAGVRTCLGGTRTVGGVFSNLCRVHRLAYTAHPYALSDIQRRRNIDALAPYTPALDGKGEYPDAALGIFTFDDAAAKLRNFAAPGLGITMQVDGSYTAITGGVQAGGPDNNGLYVLTGVASSQVLSYMATLIDFNLGVDYNAPTALDDSTNTVVSASVTKHASGAKIFPMQRLADGTYTYKTIGPKQGASKLTYLSKLSDSGKSHYVKEFATNESTVINGNVTWPSNLVFSIGGARRPDGSYFQRTSTKCLGVVICRGDITADDQATTRALLEA